MLGEVIEENSLFCMPKSLKNRGFYGFQFFIRNRWMKSEHIHHMSRPPIDHIIIKRWATLHTIACRSQMNLFTNTVVFLTQTIFAVPSEFLLYFFSVFFSKSIHTFSLMICKSILSNSAIGRKNIRDKSFILKRAEIPEKSMQTIGWLCIEICSRYLTIFFKRKSGIELSATSKPLEYRFCRAENYLNPVVPISLIKGNTSIEESVVENTRVSDIEITKMPSRNTVFLGRGKSFFMNSADDVSEPSFDTFFWPKTLMKYTTTGTKRGCDFFEQWWFFGDPKENRTPIAGMRILCPSR